MRPTGAVCRMHVDQALVAVVLAMAGGGCASLLGYDEVSFSDDPDADAGTAGGGASSGGGGLAGAGGGGSAAEAGFASGGGGVGAAGGASGSGGFGATGGTSGNGGTGGGTAGNGGSVSTGGSGGVGATGGAGGNGGGSACQKWKALDLTEGAWSGDAASCNAGEVLPPGRANALGLLNYCRSLVGLPAVSDDATKNKDAQACALMMHANQTLDHYPPTSWKCYSPAGAQVAIKSLLEGGGGALGGMRILLDSNDAHRFALLGPNLGSIGIGATNLYGCFQWLPQSGSAPTLKPWFAWPPAGQVPYELLAYLGVTIPWTVHSSPKISGLGNGQMTITDGGVKLPGKVVSATDQWGFFTAIRFEPQGWKIEPGHTYKVEVTGISTPISYQVEVIACP